MAKRMKHTRSSIRSIRKSPRSQGSGRKKTPLTEQNTSPRDIIDRMSRSFRMIDEEISFKNSPRYSRKDIFTTSASSSTPQELGSLDCYDFSQEDDDCRLRLDLSPIKPQKTPASRKKENKMPASRKMKEKTPATKNTKKRSRSTNNQKETTEISATKKLKVNTVAMRNVKNLKKKSTPATRSQPSRVACTGSPGDSGVFMTPPSLVDNYILADIATSTPAITPVSTRHGQPSIPLPPEPTDAAETLSGPGYEYPVSPKLSPVKKYGIPRSAEMGVLYNSVDLPSPADNSEEPSSSFKVLDISRTYSSYSGIGFYDRPLSTRKKSNKKPKKQSVGRYEALADQMNQEFDQFDDFQFSME